MHIFTYQSFCKSYKVTAFDFNIIKLNQVTGHKSYEILYTVVDKWIVIKYRQYMNVYFLNFKVWMSLIQNLKMIIFLRDRSFVFPHKLSKLIGKCKLGSLEFAFQNIRHSFYSAIKAANLWKLVTINIFLTFSGSYCQTTLEKSMMKFWTGKLICINGFRVSVSTTSPSPTCWNFPP